MKHIEGHYVFTALQGDYILRGTVAGAEEEPHAVGEHDGQVREQGAVHQLPVPFVARQRLPFPEPGQAPSKNHSTYKRCTYSAAEMDQLCSIMGTSDLSHVPCACSTAHS